MSSTTNAVATTEATPSKTPDGQLSRDFCGPLANRAPQSFEIIYEFEDPATKDLPIPANTAYVKCVAIADGQQWLIVASRTMGPLSAEDIRRKASEAIKKTQYARHGMNEAHAMFALHKGVPVNDAHFLFSHQGECEFCRAFRLLPSSF